MKQARRMPPRRQPTTASVVDDSAAGRQKAVRQQRSEEQAIRSKEIGKRITRLRQERGWSGNELAKRAGLIQQNVHDAEIGKFRQPRCYPEIAQALGITLEELVTEQRAPTTPMIPLIGAAAAGKWLDAGAVDMGEGTVPRSFHPDYTLSEQYALRVEGESMNRHIPDGSIAICTPYEKARSAPTVGDKVHVIRYRDQLEEWTLKILRRRGETLELWPDSFDQRYQEPIVFNPHGSKANVRVEIRGLVIMSYLDHTQR